jgi:hypothetical protein
MQAGVVVMHSSNPLECGVVVIQFLKLAGLLCRRYPVFKSAWNPVSSLFTLQPLESFERVALACPRDFAHPGRP